MKLALELLAVLWMMLVSLAGWNLSTRVDRLEHTSVTVAESRTLVCKQAWKKTWICRELEAT